jgi:hypothetical protein
MLEVMRVVSFALSSAFLFLGTAWAQFGWLGSQEYFKPTNRLTGLGVERHEQSDTVLKRRTDLMIDSQTFGILRDPQALEGAQRITRLKPLFESASRSSGFPADVLASIAYLESWGIANAQSPAGPKGIMQIAGATARAMGLRLIYATKYRYATETRRVKNKRGKVVVSKVRRRIPYQVLVRDERLVPQRAVPAAAAYLARLEQRYGRDWAIFAYHCGEGCANEVRSIVERSSGLKGTSSVAEAFFFNHPAHNRELYETMQHHMERDFSPTYWFRIMRAQQLLSMYETEPATFNKLFGEYRNQLDPSLRAPHRLSVWLKPDDFAFKTCEDLKREQGKSLVRVFEDPKYFGFSLRRTGIGAIGEDDPLNQEFYFQAAPSTVGTIAYIAFETRRLHEAMKPKGEKFVPLDITSLVRPMDLEQKLIGSDELPTHCSGMVFDLNHAAMPNGQREALEFVLRDLGYNGYLGFVKESSNGMVYHIGAAPTARDFFTRIYQEATNQARSSD